MYKEKIEFLSKQATKLDPFFNLVDSKKLFSEIRDELDEAEKEFKNWDFKELEKELWDVFRDFLMLSHKLEKEGKINIEKIYEWIYKKMSSRKPFLEENREVTKEEAIEVWNNAKRKEWYSDDRLRNEKCG
jgi:NTP pyrophosphatase (non-canonical NTP hydrolase)